MTKIPEDTVVSILQKSKSAFGRRSDSVILSTGLSSILPFGRINWLEVGVGSGENLSCLLTALSNGRSFDVVALDPELSSLRLEGNIEQLLALQCGIEEFDPAAKTWHCINIRQSIYYFRDPFTTLSHLIKFLDSKGVIAVTLWTRDCLLFKFHAYLASLFAISQGPIPGAEELVTSVSTWTTLTASAKLFEAPLDIAALLSDDKIANSFLRLAARTLPIPIEARARGRELIQSFLDQTKAQPVRRNAVIFITWATGSSFARVQSNDPTPR